MTTTNQSNWRGYYQKIVGREARPLLVQALQDIPQPILPADKLAIDIGSGDGTETVFLLAQGWQVLAVDGDPSSLEFLMDKVPANLKANLQTRITKFEQIDDLPPADLVHSSYSLPFCPPAHFGHLWEIIDTAIQPGGYFVGQFFGPHDSWAGNNPTLTFLSKEEVQNLFIGFTIETFNEIDEDGEAANGPKHWHIFEVNARKI